ncbi:MAG: xanthine dehydrogenase family Fe-S subunit [Gammaproteobacteria bacterium]
MKNITLKINGETVSAAVEPRTHLADFLREHLLLTGTHIGCEHGICGACTVDIHGEIARSCITYAVQCDGAEITTIEGFDDDPLMARLREAFTNNHALQCGYCTPGMLIAARDLIRRVRHTDEQRIREELSGNLCRCTGYVGIVDAVCEVMAEGLDFAALPACRSTVGPAPGTPPRMEHSRQNGSSAFVDSERPSSASTQPGAHAGQPLAIEDFTEEGLARLSQSFTVEHLAVDVWTFLKDLDQVARCLPGATITKQDGDEFEGEIRVKLGPITTAFANQGRITRDDGARRATVITQGRDTRSASRIKGRIDYRVNATSEGGARVDVKVGYALTGALAQFGRGGIVEDLANRLTQAFAHNMAQRLAGGDSNTGVEQETAEVLDAGRLVWSALWGRIRDTSRRLLGRG